MICLVQFLIAHLAGSPGTSRHRMFISIALPLAALGLCSMQWFSAAQCVGYLTLVLGILAFSQKNDFRLRSLVGTQCVAYALHFLLLGNIPAAVSAAVSSARSYASLCTRSIYVAAIAVIANLAIGLHFVHSPAGLLPVAASVMGSAAMFLLRGIPLRVVLLMCSLCWLGNNLLCHSVGGTVLELFVSSSNLVTILRLTRNVAGEDELLETSEA